MKDREIHQYIEMNPFRGNEPIFRGTSIPIKHVIDDFAKGMNSEEILTEHKELNKNHLQALFVHIRITFEELEHVRLGGATGMFSFWKYLFSYNKK